MRIASAARHFNTRPSALVQIENDATALDFDLACSYRLQVFDDKQSVEQTIALAKGIAVCCGLASPEIFDKSDAEELDELTAFDTQKIADFRRAKETEK